MTVLFDGLALSRRLEANGSFTRPQAEALVDGLHDALVSSVVTKHDLYDVKNELQAEIKAVKTGLQAEIHVVKTELQAEISVLRAEMTGKFNQLTWMLGVIVTGLVALLLHAFTH